MKLEKRVEDLSVKVVKSGNSVAGKYLGLLLASITGLVILFYFYAKMWCHIDFLRVLFQGGIGGYI
jgi:hypothetical protein